MQRTLVLLKPDAIQRGLVGPILGRLEARGLKIVATKMLWMDQELAHRHYHPHIDKPFFQGLIQFITSSPVIALVLEGENAVEVVRATMGVTDPAKAMPGTIRGDWAVDIGYNLVHGSDSSEEAEREIANFFSPQEMFNYRRDVDPWITGS